MVNLKRRSLLYLLPLNTIKQFCFIHLIIFIAFLKQFHRKESKSSILTDRLEAKRSMSIFKGRSFPKKFIFKNPFDLFLILLLSISEKWKLKTQKA